MAILRHCYVGKLTAANRARSWFPDAVSSRPALLPHVAPSPPLRSVSFYRTLQNWGFRHSYKLEKATCVFSWPGKCGKKMLRQVHFNLDGSQAANCWHVILSAHVLWRKKKKKGPHQTGRHHHRPAPPPSKTILKSSESSGLDFFILFRWIGRWSNPEAPPPPPPPYQSLRLTALASLISHSTPPPPRVFIAPASSVSRSLYFLSRFISLKHETHSLHRGFLVKRRKEKNLADNGISLVKKRCQFKSTHSGPWSAGYLYICPVFLNCECICGSVYERSQQRPTVRVHLPYSS